MLHLQALVKTLRLFLIQKKLSRPPPAQERCYTLVRNKSITSLSQKIKIEREIRMEKQTMIRVRKNKENPFVMLDKRLFEDTRLSWKAKGLLGYLLSRPDDWTIRVSDLIKRSTDGETSVYTGLKELEENGYMERVRVRDDKGKFLRVEYFVYEQSIITEDSPNPEKSSVLSTSGKSRCGKSRRGKSTSGKSSTTNNNSTNNNSTNNDITNINNNNKIDSTNLGTNSKNDANVNDVVVNSNNLSEINKAIEELELAYKEIAGTEDTSTLQEIIGNNPSDENIERMRQALQYIKNEYYDKNRKINNLPGLIYEAYTKEYKTQPVDPVSVKHKKRLEREKEEWEKEYSTPKADPEVAKNGLELIRKVLAGEN